MHSQYLEFCTKPRSSEQRSSKNTVTFHVSLFIVPWLRVRRESAMFLELLQGVVCYYWMLLRVDECSNEDQGPLPGPRWRLEPGKLAREIPILPDQWLRSQRPRQSDLYMCSLQHEVPSDMYRIPAAVIAWRSYSNTDFNSDVCFMVLLVSHVTTSSFTDCGRDCTRLA